MERDREQRQHLGLMLLPDDEAPARARRLMRVALAPWLDGRGEQAELVLSELITNAVRHGQQTGLNAVGLVLEVVAGVLRIEVIDNGAGFVAAAALSEPGANGGWGLMLVDAMSDRWGIDRGERGTRVWAELDPVGPDRAKLEPDVSVAA